MPGEQRGEVIAKIGVKGQTGSAKSRRRRTTELLRRMSSHLSGGHIPAVQRLHNNTNQRQSDELSCCSWPQVSSGSHWSPW